MLNKKQLDQIAANLHVVATDYLHCINSKDDCIKAQTPVRAACLRAAVSTLDGVDGVIWPETLTESLLNRAIRDSQDAF